MPRLSHLRTHAVLFLSLAIAGCGGGGSDGGTMTPTPPRLTVALVTKDSFFQDATQFNPGENVGIEISLTNASMEIVTLTFPSSQTVDFYVTDPNGDEVWRLSDISVGQPVVTDIILNPSETRTVLATWDQVSLVTNAQVPSGQYTAFGSFLDQSDVAQIGFTIL